MIGNLRESESMLVSDKVFNHCFDVLTDRSAKLDEHEQTVADAVFGRALEHASDGTNDGYLCIPADEWSAAHELMCRVKQRMES